MTNLIRLDPSSPVALYLQISEQIRRWVALGALRPGDRLPTVRELAARTRVNRNTAARAIQQLETEGIVRTRVGQGTFVAEGAASVGRERLERVLDAAIDRLLVDARTVGASLDELGGRIAKRIERFRREQGAGGERGEDE
jgi:GntR family transcriptional regulator